MKVSLITVCYNAARYLPDCIQSVLEQDHPDIEYLIIDGNSTDGTQEIVQSFGDRVSQFVSEPDQGIYDAMNKGLKLATGEVVGILNADDVYARPDIISQVVRCFAETGTDTLYGDLVYVPENDLDKIVRYYPGKDFHPRKMQQGNMPPHPTFFVKRNLYAQHGLFSTDYQICADFELMVRLFRVHEVSYQYLPLTMVKMRTGGSSTRGLKSTLTINEEMLHALRSNQLQSSRLRIYSKYFRKVFQLFQKPSNLEA